MADTRICSRPALGALLLDPMFNQLNNAGAGVIFST